MTSLSPPLAPKKEHLTTTHCDVIEDPWFWLKDPNYPEVKNIEILDYLKVENNWYLSHMAPLKTLSDKIQKEFRGRLKQDDEGVPFKDGSYHY
ncbi:MAG: S9 family peptidase, partial [Sphingomonadales bacterium]